jgi:hypothetical protein
MPAAALLKSSIDVAAGCERYYGKSIRIRFYDLECAVSDGACGTENGDLAKGTAGRHRVGVIYLWHNTS